MSEKNTNFAPVSHLTDGKSPTMKISNHPISAFIILTVFALLLPLQVMAQRLTAHRGTVSDSYNFWFYVPTANAPSGAISAPLVVADSVPATEGDLQTASSRKPLVVFLHGASLCGRNLSRVRTYGTLDAISKGLRLDAYVLAPQNPGGAWNPTRINRLIDWAESCYAIDTTRIYVLGMSLGGYGTLDYAAHSPQRVAAAMALCGGATSNDLAGLCEVPLCIFHGTGDRAVSWQCSQSVVNIMKAKGGTSRLIYQLLDKQSHGALARYLYLPATYEWLFQHALTDEGRPVNRDYDFRIQVLQDVYRQLPKPEQALLVEDSNGSREREDSGTASSSGVYVVRKGDSLSKIAQRHRTTVAHLCRLNGLKRTAVLQLGQKIRY